MFGLLVGRERVAQARLMEGARPTTGMLVVGPGDAQVYEVGSKEVPLGLLALPALLLAPCSCADPDKAQHMAEALRGGARLRVVLGTGTNICAGILLFAGSQQGVGAELVNVSDFKPGEDIVITQVDALLLPIHDKDDDFEDFLVAFNLIAEGHNGRPLSVRQLKAKLKRAGRPVRAFRDGKPKQTTAIVNASSRS